MAFEVVIWRSLYGLGGPYMALRSILALDDLRGRPQMTSILLSARDEKFGRNSLYGLGGHGMTSEVGLR